MENKVLKKYFRRTIWRKGQSIPTAEELVKMEDTISVKYIKPDDSAPSKKYVRYVPIWA